MQEKPATLEDFTKDSSLASPGSSICKDTILLWSEFGTYYTVPGFEHMVPSCGTVLKAVGPLKAVGTLEGDVCLVGVSWSLMVHFLNAQLLKLAFLWSLVCHHGSPLSGALPFLPSHETLSSSETVSQNIFSTAKSEVTEITALLKKIVCVGTKG